MNAEASGRSGVRGRAVHVTVLHRPGLQPRLQAGIRMAPRERGVVGRWLMTNHGVNAEASGRPEVRGRTVHGTVHHRAGLQPRL